MFFKRGASPGELYLNIANPYRLIAVSRYVQTKGVEGLSEKDTEEMQLFSRLFRRMMPGKKILNGCICYVLKKIVAIKPSFLFGKMRALFFIYYIAGGIPLRLLFLF